MMKIARTAAVLVTLGILALPQIVAAQYSQDFEGLNGSPAGVVLTGQDGYYLPPGTVSTDFKCYTYAGNALGVVQNPDGGAQFIGGTGPGDGATYARAERGVEFGYLRMELLYDFCGIFSGTPPGSNNLGSFSMRQASVNTVHINLFTWVDPTNPTAINSNYVAYDAAGIQFQLPGILPGPEWGNLTPNHWYRCRTVVDLGENTIVEVGIRDLSGGNEAVYQPTGWYLIGGAGGYSPPDGIRFFGGGGGPGNTSCWDNAIVREEVVGQGACCLQNGDCIITTEADCQGEYMGDGTTCTPNPCQATAVERASWGAIKSQYR